MTPSFQLPTSAYHAEEHRTTGWCRRRSPALLSALSAALLALAPGAPSQSTLMPPVELENWNGFVADTECASCHQDISESFSSHSMARSFAEPGRARIVESFAEGDTASYVEGDTLYQFVRSGNELEYRRWQVGPDGAPIHLWQRTIDWVLGSGANSRVYLVQSAEGALYELPVAWYTQTREFAPTPGTMETEREGRLRVIRRPCLFCHNAVPSDPAFVDHRFAPDLFPHELPEGIGCQRCHGPGLPHVEAAQRVAASRPTTPEDRRTARNAVRATVVNPSRLGPARRRDVCAQCHHQPAVALFGQRRLDRGDYEFKAGDPLHEFLLKLDVLEAREDGSPRPTHERFEINHHAYRLEQSACFTESPAGSLGCTSCHDPHQGQTAAETFERARSRCLACHDPAAQMPSRSRPSRPSRPSGNAPVPGTTSSVGPTHFEATDCVTCHMPRRRTEDIVRVVMTDHRIQRRPAPEAQRLAPLAEKTDDILDVFVLEPDPSLTDPSEDLIRAMSGIRAGALSLAADLERLIAEAHLEPSGIDLREPEMRLANAWVRLGREAEALPILERLRHEPGYQLVATELAAVAHARSGESTRALELLDELIESLEPTPARLLFYRGAIRLGARHPDACEDLARATERNEFLRRAWTYLGQCRETQQRLEAAVLAYRQALRLDPSEERTTALLVSALRRLGREAEAGRIELHARRQATVEH